MHTNLRRSIGAAIVAGFVVTGGLTAAAAGTSYVSFDVTMPRLQQGVTTAAQTKSGAINTASTARVDGIGGGYKANLRTARTSGSEQYGTERKNLGKGTWNLNSPFAKGAKIGLNIHNASWTAVNVQIFGAFKSN